MVEGKESGGRCDACSQEYIARSLNKSVSLNECPECGGPLRFGSRDPLEGDYFWCMDCRYGPILFPLFSGPPVKQITSARELLGIIDADALKSPKRPVILNRESPHEFMDPILNGERMVRRVR